MSTPFDNLPLNTNKIYIAAFAKDGCHIIVPVDFMVNTVDRLAELKRWLTNQ